MSGKWVALTAGLLLFASTIGLAAEDAESEGDQKIREAIEQIEETEEEAREKAGEYVEPSREGDEESEFPGVFVRVFVQVLTEVILEYAPTMRFADYPYSPASEYLYNTSILTLPEEEKWFSMQIASDFSYHFDGTYGNVNRICAQLTGFHLNVYNHHIFSRSESFSALSANMGLTLFVPGFLLSGFLGTYTLDVLESPCLSFGFYWQLFLPGRIHLDLFNVNAALGAARFSHWTFMIDLSLWRLSLGAGYHHSIVAGTIFSGPSVRVTFWL